MAAQVQPRRRAVAVAAVAQSGRSGPVQLAGLAAQESARQLLGQHRPARTSPERSQLAAVAGAAAPELRVRAARAVAATVRPLARGRPEPQIQEAVEAVQAPPHHLAAMAAAV